MDNIGNQDIRTSSKSAHTACQLSKLTTESQIEKLTTLGSDYEVCLHLFDRSCATFLAFHVTVTSPHD